MGLYYLNVKSLHGVSAYNSACKLANFLPFKDLKKNFFKKSFITPQCFFPVSAACQIARDPRTDIGHVGMPFRLLCKGS
jgi:hypothetical protein